MKECKLHGLGLIVQTGPARTIVNLDSQDCRGAGLTIVKDLAGSEDLPLGAGEVDAPNVSPLALHDLDVPDL